MNDQPSPSLFEALDAPVAPSTSFPSVKGGKLPDRKSHTFVELVLASGSQSKCAVLKQLGLGFIIDAPEIDEHALLDEDFP
jgi:hypothetical protein